jgi:hypothetical protein
LLVSLRATVPVHFSVEAVDGIRRSDRDNITSSNHCSAGIERVKSYSPSAHIVQMRRRNWMYNIYAFASDDSLSCRAVPSRSTVRRDSGVKAASIRPPKV